MADIQIKRATADDTELVSDLSTVTFIETYRGTCTDEDLVAFIDRSFNEITIEEELNDPQDHYYIAFIDGFPAGYMRLKEEDDEYPLETKYKAIQLKRLYVLKEFQSQKIGSALLSYAFRVMSNYYELLWLGVWENNEKAIAFYEHHGFSDTNQVYSFYVGNTKQTDRWMTRYLNN